MEIFIWTLISTETLGGLDREPFWPVFTDKCYGEFHEEIILKESLFFDMKF